MALAAHFQALTGETRHGAYRNRAHAQNHGWQRAGYSTALTPTSERAPPHMLDVAPNACVTVNLRL